MKIEFISKNKDGNFYVGYRIKVQRGIKGKTKSKVDELLIVGIPEKRFDDWCRSEGICVHVENLELGEEKVYGLVGVLK